MLERIDWDFIETTFFPLVVADARRAGFDTTDWAIDREGNQHVFCRLGANGAVATVYHRFGKPEEADRFFQGVRWALSRLPQPTPPTPAGEPVPGKRAAVMTGQTPGPRPDFAEYHGQRLVQIQPKMLPSFSTPYPYTIAPDGTVVGQDFWRGDPSALLGFQVELEVQRVDLSTEQFLANPQQAMGMYPVFIGVADDADDADDAGIWVHKCAVQSIVVFDPAEAVPAPPMPENPKGDRDADAD